VFDSIKADQIVIVGSGLIFKCTLTKREEIEKACGKIVISQRSDSVSEKHKVWSVEKLKTSLDRDSGDSVPTECVLVYKPREQVNGTIREVAEKFKKMIK